MAHPRAAAFDAVEAHALMPDRCRVGADRHLEQRLDDAEQPLQHARLGQVLLHFLVAEGVARFLQPFAGPGEVPGLQLGQAQVSGGEGAQFGQVALGVRPRAAAQVAQEADHLLGRLRHLRHQRELAEAGVAQQRRFFVPQFQDLAHQAAVVEFGRAELAGAGVVGHVQGLAQRAVVAVHQQRPQAGRVQRQLEAGPALGLGRGAGGAADVGWHAVQARFVDIEREAVGGVQHMLGELLRQLGAALLDLRKALARRALQLGAAEHEVALRIGQRLAARGVQAGGGRRRGQRLVLGVQPLVGAHAREEVGHARQHRGVGGAQFGRVGHRVQMPHDAPGVPQLLNRHVERARQRVVVGRHGIAHGGFQRGVGRGQQGLYRQRRMLGAHGGEIGVGAALQQRVGVVHAVRWRRARPLQACSSATL